jgi:hypothetical protein
MVLAERLVVSLRVDHVYGLAMEQPPGDGGQPYRKTPTTRVTKDEPA